MFTFNAFLILGFLNKNIMNKYKYSTDELVKAIANSTNWAEVCKSLGTQQSGGMQCYFKKRATKTEIDFSHFVGSAHQKNRVGNNPRDIQLYLSNEFPCKSHVLKLKLIKADFKEYRCEDCLRSKWMGKKIPLELHHIDKNHNNNNLSNLKIVCRNCHWLYNNK